MNTLEHVLSHVNNHESKKALEQIMTRLGTWAKFGEEHVKAKIKTRLKEHGLDISKG